VLKQLKREWIMVTVYDNLAFKKNPFSILL